MYIHIHIYTYIWRYSLETKIALLHMRLRANFANMFTENSLPLVIPSGVVNFGAKYFSLHLVPFSELFNRLNIVFEVDSRSY